MAERTEEPPMRPNGPSERFLDAEGRPCTVGQIRSGFAGDSRAGESQIGPAETDGVAENGGNPSVAVIIGAETWREEQPRAWAETWWGIVVPDHDASLSSHHLLATLRTTSSPPFGPL